MRAIVAFAGAMVMSGVVQAQGSNTTTTTSTSSSQALVDTAASVRIDTYSTRLLGVLDGSTTVYDQSFNVAFGDAAMQAALSSAQAALSAAAAPQSVNVTGPSLISSTTSPVASSVSTVVDNTTTTQTVTTELWVGPQTILIGNRDLGGTPFFVAPGTENINVNTHTLTTIFRTITTTTTFLTSAVYTLFGTTQGGGGGNGGGTVPEPATLALLTLMLAGMAWRFRPQRTI